MSSNEICQACMLVEKLNAMGKPKLELEVEPDNEAPDMEQI